MLAGLERHAKRQSTQHTTATRDASVPDSVLRRGGEAHLVSLTPHQQHTEDIEHFQFVHDLMHNLHGLRQLGPS